MVLFLTFTINGSAFMSDFELLLPFECPNPECKHQMTEVPQQTPDGVYRCPKCGDGFRVNIEIEGSSTPTDLTSHIANMIQDQIQSDLDRHIT